MLANGEREAGVSIYFMDEQIDAGDLCWQRTFPIERGETLNSFLVRPKAVAAELFLDVLKDLRGGTVARRSLDLTTGSVLLLARSGRSRAFPRRRRAAVVGAPADRGFPRGRGEPRRSPLEHPRARHHGRAVTGPAAGAEARPDGPPVRAGCE
jgi:hypothetical protein